MITIYHNPRCGKSRAAIAFFEKHKVPFIVVEYLKTPPTKKDLHTIFQKLVDDPALAIRKKEPQYKELALPKNPSVSAIISAIATHPIVLERPMVVSDSWAKVARDEDSLAWCKKHIS